MHISCQVLESAGNNPYAYANPGWKIHSQISHDKKNTQSKPYFFPQAAANAEAVANTSAPTSATPSAAPSAATPAPSATPSATAALELDVQYYALGRRDKG